MSKIRVPSVDLSMRIPHRVVRASAGTGKTYDLSTRYLHLLRQGAKPDTILATTFTCKAAGEILGRVLLRLANATQNSTDAAALRRDLQAPSLTSQDCGRMLAGLCRGLHRVSVSTIDSFFHRVANCFRQELGLRPDVQVVGDDDPRIVRLRRQAIDAVLGADQLPKLLQMMRRLHHDQTTRSVTDAIDRIVGGQSYQLFRQNPQAERWSLSSEHVWRRLGDAALVDAVDTLRTLRRVLPPDKRWARAWKADVETAQSSDWDAFLNQGLASKIAAQGCDASYYRQPVPPAVVNAYEPLIEHARAQLVDRVTRQTQATYRLLVQFDRHFTRLRQEYGILLYSDIPLKLAAAVCDGDNGLLPDLYYRLDTRVTHLLLDEFQDTSVPQWHILRPFAQEVCAHSDGSRTFYCVGDLKQAIYGWRGGRAEIFDQIEQELHLEPGSGRSQNISYRSSQVVLNTINRVFSSIATNPAVSKARPEAQQWQERFQHHIAYEKHKPGYVELVTPAASLFGPSPDSDDTDDRELTLAASACEICAARKIAQVTAAAPGRTVGVLVNTNQAVGSMIQLLGRQGLTASGEGGNSLTDDPAVRLVLAAIRLADHPGHAVAAFHVCHSPLGSIVGLGSTQPPAAASVALSIRRTLLSRGYAAVVSDWSRKLAPACGDRNVRRLRQLVELAHCHDQMITLRPMDFVAVVESAAVEEPSPASVRVMTVNKAKGLEFDIVVLPDLHRRLLDESQILLCVHQDLSKGQVRGVYRNAAAHVRAACSPLAQAYDQCLGRQFHDDLCKLYVAMTRARHALHMVIRPLKPNRNGQPGADGWTTPSFATILRRSLCEVEESFDGGQALYQHGDANWAKHDRCIGPVAKTHVPTRLSIGLVAGRDRQTPSRSWRRITPSSLESADRVQVRDVLAIRTPQSHQRGTLIHAWFEQITWLSEEVGAALPPDDTLRAIARRVVDGRDDRWVSEQLRRFKEMLKQPAVRELLSPRTDQKDHLVTCCLWRERAFAVQVDSRLLHGQFDRVVVYEQGGKPMRADLIDYKTDHVTPDTLARAVHRYHPQIQAYRSALSVMLNLPTHSIRAQLLFVDSGDCVPIR